MKDYIGIRFGRLIVLEYDRTDKDMYGKYYRIRKYWKCQCDCGNILSIREDVLPKRKSCGCSNSHYLPFGESAKRALYKSYKNSSKIRNIEFNLNKDDFFNLTSKNCVYCGSIPSSVYKTSKSRTGYYIYNGIDRVDNSIGYNLDNCVPCCSDCNYAKSDRDRQEFLDWIEKVYNFSIKATK